MKQQVDRILGYILVTLMAAMTLDVLWGVLTRYIMGSQASWSEELARFLLIWIGILGAAYASGQKMHLAIDLLSTSVSPKNQKLLNRVIGALVILFALLVLVIGGSRLIYITLRLGQLSPALRLPMSLVYAVVPISGLLVIFYKIWEWRSAPEPQTQD